MRQQIFELLGKVIYVVLYFYWAWYLHRTSRARIILVAEDRVLLVKPWLGLGGWDFPGGGAGRGEGLVETACRELFEETKVRVDSSGAEFVQKDQISHGLIRFTAHYYFVKINKMIPPKPHRPEIAQARWVSKEEAGLLKVDKDVSALIDRCLEK